MVIEKPFGTTSPRRSELNRDVLAVLDESQVFRIDHYLGKETVQNMLAFRFANGMFEPIWNRNYIDYVQITAAEDIGIGTRAGYYDTRGRAARPRPEPHAAAADAAVHGAAGQLRRADEVRDEKVKVLHAITPDPAPRRRAVRAQYAAGHGRRRGRARATSTRRACRDDSHTETYVGAPARGRQLALGGRAVLPAHGQAARAQGHRDRGDAQAGAAPRLRRRRARWACSRTSSILTMQPNEGVSLSLGGEDPRHAHADPPGEHGVPLRDGVPVRSRPRPTSG